MADEENETENPEEVVDGEVEPDELIDGEEDVDPEALLDEDGTDEGEVDSDLLVVDPVITDEGSTLATPPTKPKTGEEDEEDEELQPDDVEADLSAILQEKLTTPVEVDEDVEDETGGDDRTDGVERLQPRRPDETQCDRCYYLVRQNAPGCPVDDPVCPLFPNS